MKLLFFSDFLLSNWRLEADPWNGPNAPRWATAKDIKGYRDTNNSPKNMLEWSQASSGKGLSIPHWSTKAPLSARHKSCNPWKQSRAAEEKPICFAAVCNICRKGVGFLGFFCCSSQGSLSHGQQTYGGESFTKVRPSCDSWPALSDRCSCRPAQWASTTTKPFL